MSEMIERVAKAIATADEQNGALPWDGLNKHARSWKMDQARAAMEAMREPTLEMIGAALRAMGEHRLHESRNNLDETVVTDLMSAMIDAALSKEG